jgi:CubicO group peptidase (beta-lactamase class C family)
LTASAILRLVEDGRLSLDKKAFSVLTEFDAPADLHTNKATVRNLLGMTNKWGSDKTFDPSLEWNRLKRNWADDARELHRYDPLHAETAA